MQVLSHLSVLNVLSCGLLESLLLLDPQLLAVVGDLCPASAGKPAVAIRNLIRANHSGLFLCDLNLLTYATWVWP